MTTRTTPRLLSIDALRGLAVMLMIIQHVIYWLCSELHSSSFMRGAGALGGLSAPLFIVLAGIGITLSEGRHTDTDRKSIGRGLTLMGYAYFLNITASSWFSFQSWYVLHLIGIGILLSPIFRKISSPILMALLLLVIIVTAGIQYTLDTPLRLFNVQMARTTLPGGGFRLALAEGFFPVFPWLAFFMAGLLAGRWVVDGHKIKIGYFAIALIAAAACLAGLYHIGVPFTTSDVYVRIFKPIPYFYPALTPITLFLMAAALFLVILFLAMEEKKLLGKWKWLASVGRASLTFFILHIIIIRESAIRFGFWHTFSVLETMAVALPTLFLFATAAVLWRKNSYVFGAEWLLRRLAG